MSPPPPVHPAPLPANLTSILTTLVTPKRSLPHLTDLYTSTFSTLPATILSRMPSPHLLHQDLIQIMDAKLTFGQNRPALRSMIANLSPKDVIKTSTEAFKALLTDPSTPSSSRERIEKALKALLPLKGVGPATASLILSLVSEEVPFFSDEAAVEVLKPGGGRKGLKYTLPEYWRFFGLVGELVGEEEGGRRGWERRVWGEKVLEGAAADGKGTKAVAAAATVVRKKRGHEKETKEETGVAKEGESSSAGGRPKRARVAKKSV